MCWRFRRDKFFDWFSIVISSCQLQLRCNYSSSNSFWGESSFLECPNYSSIEQHIWFSFSFFLRCPLLRLPDELAARVHVLIKEGQKSKSGPPSLLDVKPQSPTVPSNDFIFTVDGVDYPALVRRFYTNILVTSILMTSFLVLASQPANTLGKSQNFWQQNISEKCWCWTGSLHFFTIIICQIIMHSSLLDLFRRCYKSFWTIKNEI